MMELSHPTRSRIAALAVGVVLFCAGPSQAERVVFNDMRVLSVESVEEKDDLLLLHFGGGNSMTVASSQVYEILPDREEEREIPKPVEQPWRKKAGIYAEYIESAAKLHQLDPELILAVALVESGLNPRALSPKGAIGLMQLMPGTADQLSVSDPHDPQQNLEAGAKWLKKMLRVFDGNLDLALAAYNAGENAVRRFGGVPPFAETEIYIEKVYVRLEQLNSTGS